VAQPPCMVSIDWLCLYMIYTSVSVTPFLRPD
jgi:hypothetical protein